MANFTYALGPWGRRQIRTDAMSNPQATRWTTTPGGPEFRLERVDGRATVDVGLPKQFGQRLGPGFRSEKWGGRGWMEISGYGVELNRAGEIKSHPKHGDVYECECTRMARGRKRGERHIIVPGSVEYEIEWDALADVPEDGYVDFLLDFSGGLTWDKQLPLAQSEIDHGASRPDNVVNSYAIYGSQSGRFLRPSGYEIVNYETGKFGHVYRPQLIDAKGNSLWCDQTAPLAGPNRLRVYLDREWLNDASYPVVLDPTFGFTSVGASTYLFNSGYVCALGPHACVSNGSATSVTVYITTRSGGNGVFGIYDGTPKNALKDTANISYESVTRYSWNTFNLDSALAVQAGTNYHIGAYCQDPIDSWTGRFDSNTSGIYSNKHGIGNYSGNGVLPNNGSWSYVDQWKVSAYVTYEVPSPIIKRFGDIGSRLAGTFWQPRSTLIGR